MASATLSRLVASIGALCRLVPESDRLSRLSIRLGRSQAEIGKARDPSTLSEAWLKLRSLLDDLSSELVTLCDHSDEDHLPRRIRSVTMKEEADRAIREIGDEIDQGLVHARAAATDHEGERIHKSPLPSASRRTRPEV
jgi:hypothetical protein